MGKNTRYDKLRETLAKNFNRSKTFTPSVDADSNTLVFDARSPEGVGNDSFLERAPFNSVTVRNMSDVDLRVSFGPDGDTGITVPATTGAVETLDACELSPVRYVRYLRLFNEDADTDISEGDVEIVVGIDVDSVELRLLEMSGLLNIEA